VPKVYVVTEPSEIRGICRSWPECEAKVKSVRGAKFQAVASEEQAHAMLRGEGPTLTPGLWAFVDGRQRCVEDAETVLRAAVGRAPDHAAARSELGRVLFEQARYEDAAAALTAAIARNPIFARAHSSLGLAFERLGRYAEAEAALREALRLNPRDAVARSNLATVLRRQRRPADADYHLGVTLERQGRYRSVEGDITGRCRRAPARRARAGSSRAPSYRTWRRREPPPTSRRSTPRTTAGTTEVAP
jgi:tetratricopeptide (TPR) repeat protein